MLWADNPRSYGPKSTENLADIETNGAIIPADRFGAIQMDIPVANIINTKEFVTVLDDQDQTPLQADSR